MNITSAQLQRLGIAGVKLQGVAHTPAKVSKPRRGVPNKWESSYARLILEPRRLAGLIKWYGFEASSWRIAEASDGAKGAKYCPDFTVIRDDGSVYFVEVKGHWKEAARLRVKVFVNEYPFELHIVRWVGGKWQTDVMKGRE